MLKSDVLSQLKQLKSDIKASRNLATGTVKGTGQKFGFVTLDETGKDIYLPPDEMQKVIPGDKVEVEIKKDAKNKNMAVLERLIKSEVKTFCGKYVTKGSAHFVEPDLPGMSRWIFIPPPKRKKAKAKDYVLCKVTQHPFKSGKAQAAILEVIGEENDANIEWNYAIAKHQINESWSPEIETELEQYSEEKLASVKAGRVDLSAIPFVTIDAKSTTDMDDALWAEATESGWNIKVAIADPAALIARDSAIEQEAIKRGSSIYFPGKQVSMLPTKLSSDLCSLVEGKERLAKVMSLNIAQDGAINDFEIVEAVVCSKKKASYAEVAAFLDDAKTLEGDDEAITASLTQLDAATNAILGWRQSNALIHEDRDEFFIELNEARKIEKIHKKQSTRAHKIVEECMIATNRCVAEYLAKADVPSLFIQHEGVRSDRLEPLNQLLTERLSDEAAALDSLDGFVSNLKALSGNSEYQDIKLLIMRQLEKSHSTLKAGPHFGMGLPAYTTFTSPLRKANDYLIHQQISALIKQQAANALDEKQLAALEDAWQAGRSAVNDVEQWLKCQYMQSQKDYFDATVLRIFASGFQVRLSDNGIEGFVSTKEMEGKYSFHQDILQLKGKAASFQLDQAVQVKLKQIDWTRKQMQFEVKLPETAEEQS